MCFCFIVERKYLRVKLKDTNKQAKNQKTFDFSEIQPTFDVSQSTNKRVEEGVLCLVIIVSDKHCHADEC